MAGCYWGAIDVVARTERGGDSRTGSGGGRVRCLACVCHAVYPRARVDNRRFGRKVNQDDREGCIDLTRGPSIGSCLGDLSFFCECRARGLQRAIDPSLGLPWT